MKNNWLKKGLSFAAIASMAAITLVSCKKDDIDETGSANVKVVNASSSSTDQSFYLAGKTVIQGGLSFGEASDQYISVNSGTNLELQFRNEGSASGYATESFNLDKGGYYTVFLAGDGESARVKVFADDMAAPSAGKAKVRFIHLSDAAPSKIDIRTSAGTNLAVNLARDASSSYVELDPAVVSLQVFATGESTSLGTFDLSAFASGKIYTVYVTGSSTSSISVHEVMQN